VTGGGRRTHDNFAKAVSFDAAFELAPNWISKDFFPPSQIKFGFRFGGRKFDGDAGHIGKIPLSESGRQMGLFCAGNEGFKSGLGDAEAGFFQFVAVDGVVPAFDVEVGIVSGADEFVDDLGPVGLAEAGETVFGDAGVAEAVSAEERFVNLGVFGVDVEDPFAVFADVLKRIDELADEVGGVPFDADVIEGDGVEEGVPKGGLAGDVPVSDGQMPWALRAMFESDADPGVASALGDGAPEFGGGRNGLFGEGINGAAAALVDGCVNERPNECANGFDFQEFGDFDSAQYDAAGGVDLFWVQGVSIPGGDGADAEVAFFCFFAERGGGGFPIGIF